MEHAFCFFRKRLVNLQYEKLFGMFLEQKKKQLSSVYVTKDYDSCDTKTLGLILYIASQNTDDNKLQSPFF